MRKPAAAAPRASNGGLTQKAREQKRAPRPRPRSKRQEPPRRKPVQKPRQ